MSVYHCRKFGALGILMILKRIAVAMLLSGGALLHAATVDTVEIEGLVVNSPTTVYSAIALHKGTPFSPSDIKESIRRLYATGLFRSVTVFTTAETDSSASFRITLEEFPYCDSIELAGTKKLTRKDLTEKFPITKGRVVSDNEAYDAQAYIKNSYFKKGYRLAEVTFTTKPSVVPGNARFVFTIKEGPKVQVEHVSFSGNVAISEKKLKGEFKTKEHRWWRSGDFDDDLYKSHLDSLIMYYNDQGYLDASIVKDSVWFGDSLKNINIAIKVDEGKKYIAGKFFFAGNTIIESDSLATKILLKEGKPFVKTRFEQSKYFVENEYRESGYLWVQVEESRQFRGDTTDVTFTISEGKPAVVRKILVTGNTKTMDKVVRREIDILPGQRYRQSLLMSSRQRIMALNFFTEVKPDLQPNNDGTIDLIFTVVEKENIGTFQVGAAYSQIDGLMGTMSLGIPNFRGAGEDLKVDIQGGTNRRSVDLGFKEPWAFNSPLWLSGEIFYNWSVPNAYSSSSYGGSSSFGGSQFGSQTYTGYDTLKSYGFQVGAGRSRLAWPDSHFSIDGSYRLSYDFSSYNTDAAPTSRLAVLKAGYLSKIGFSIMRYDLDAPQFPTAGSRLTLSTQIAGLGGDYKYIKNTTKTLFQTVSNSLDAVRRI